MGSIDGPRAFPKRRLAALACVVAAAVAAFAENAGADPDASVTERLSALAAAANSIPAGAEKRAALAELASLRELSGDIEGAAAAWADAAFASGEVRDDEALLEAARCLIALGEIDRASADVRTVLITGRDADAVSRARYLGAQLSAFRGDEDAAATLAAFIDDPRYADRRPATLYLLWRLTSDDSFRARLVADHGKSPEAALSSSSARAAVSIARTPLWLFFPAGAGVPVAVGTAATGVRSAGPAPVEETAATDASEIPSLAPAPVPSGSAVTLQIGLFRREVNAQALMKRLTDAAFHPRVSKRAVGGEAYFAVTVEGGADPDDTALRLKDAGFESFPLY